MKLTEKKRQDIVQAAIIEFREQGFLGAKTTRIAKQAKVSSRTLYNHFESKKALFDAIAEIVIEENRAIPAVDYRPDVAIDQQLIEALNHYVISITDAEFMGLNRLMVSEFLRDQQLSQEFFAKAAMHDYPVTGLIKQAMEAGVIRKADPVRAAHQLLALIKNFFFWPEFLLGKSMYSNDERKELMSECVAMFLAYYKRT